MNDYGLDIAVIGNGRTAALVNPDDAEVLEDLIVAAINDAKAKSEEVMREKMQDLTGGIPLPPGMQLPF